MRTTFKFALFAAMAFGIGFTAPAYAQDDTAKKEQTKTEDKQPEAPKRDQAAIDYEKAVKDLKKIDGPIALYQRKKEILIEFPEAKLNKLFYVQSTMNTGFGQDLQAGDPLTSLFNPNSFQQDDIYFLEKHDDTVWLIRPNTKFRWDAKDPLAEASARSFPRAQLADLKVEQHNPETHMLLINATEMFSGELNALTMLVSTMSGNQYSLDRDKSGPAKLYASGDMSVVKYDYHLTSGRPAMENSLAALLGGGPQVEDPRSLPLSVDYTLWFREEKNSYKPRIADPRVGYFTQDFYSVDRFYNKQMDRTERYINRWNMVKKDPSAALSEPVKPIVWTIDSSVPEKWKPAVREGILRWNKAFEKIGFKNAVQVVDAPKDDPNYDHADGTRNVIRFTMTEDAGYAVALFRTDPLTGQILNASVTVDANFAAYIGTEYAKLAMPTTTMLKARQALARESFLGTKPDEPTPKEVILNTFKYRNMNSAAANKTGWHSSMCDYQEARMEDMVNSMNIARAAGLGMASDDYVAGYLADTVAHEVGHTMGLRHNFVASATLTTDELGTPSLVQQYGVASSVMDYTPTNIVALLNKQKDALWNSSVGPYDLFAVKYGYSPLPGLAPEDDKFALSQIASKGGEKGQAFMTDEDADALNPYVQRFDSAKDPINYAAKTVYGFDLMRKWALENLPHKGESYTERNSMVLSSVRNTVRSLMQVESFVGGVVSTKGFAGDINGRATMAPVPYAQQRQAMGLIVKYGLSVNALDVPDSVLLTMNSDPWATNGGYYAPIRTNLVTNQQMLIGQLLSPAKAEVIEENAFKTPKAKDVYTIDEHYSKIIGAVFGELGTSKSINSIRREVQSFTLNGLISQASANPGAIPEDQRIAADKGLNSVSAGIHKALAMSGVDPATASHLRDMNARIERFKARTISVPR